jgi:hypothetical protein
MTAKLGKTLKQAPTTGRDQEAYEFTEKSVAPPDQVYELRWFLRNVRKLGAVNPLSGTLQALPEAVPALPLDVR